MRTFLALVPDTETALSVDRWRRRQWPLTGREVPIQNLHVTLCFLGDVDEVQLERLSESLDALLTVPLAIDVHFDEPVWHTDNALAWLACSTPSADLLALGKRLRTMAGRAGIRVDKRAFKPHMTLARRVDNPPPSPLSMPSIPCRFESVSLLESFLDKGGARYRELASWPG